MVEYIPCSSAPAKHWSLLPVTRLVSKKILIEQNIKISKSGQGKHSVYSVGPSFCTFTNFLTHRLQGFLSVGTLTGNSFKIAVIK
jgi:hypothetical protein